jgi:O-antigen/teichoic acid export membrane protein
VDARLVRGLFVTALPLSLGTAFLTIHTEADKLLLDKLSTPLEVSSFGATMRLSAAFAPIAVVLGAVTAPELARLLMRGDLKRSRQLIDLSLRLLLVLAGAVALFLTIASNDVILLLLGGKYASSGPLLAYIGWMLLPIFFATFMLEVSVAAGDFWFSTVYAGTIMFVVIVADVFLAHPYGAYGAMMAKMGALVIGCITLFVLQRKRPYIDARMLERSILKLGVCLGLGLVAYAAAHHWLQSDWLTAIIVFLTYLGMLHLFGVLHWSEVRSLIARVRRHE